MARKQFLVLLYGEQEKLYYPAIFVTSKFSKISIIHSVLFTGTDSIEKALESLNETAEINEFPETDVCREPIRITGGIINNALTTERTSITLRFPLPIAQINSITTVLQGEKTVYLNTDNQY